MDKYIPTIGLEIHAELKTQSKMFCNSKNDPDEKRPNVNICPVCMGHPGTLPTVNKEAVKSVLKIGVALGSTLADYTEFDRKNYFYPDIPKGYQLSQYKYPLVKGGMLKGVELTRIHLEEDTAKSTHDTGDYSLVDFNRAGLPLMELVTEPVIHSAKQAGDFARELQLVLRSLGIAEANMEKGEMRVEANISVSKDSTFGTKVEVKNLNSFKSVERAIEFEVARHIKALEKGEKIVQETRGFDETKGTTFSQRLKEDSHDYRYFPDPDIPKLVLSEIPEFNQAKIAKELPILPWQKREELTKNGVKAEDAEVFVTNETIGRFFNDVLVALEGDKEAIKLASNYLVSDVLGLLKGKEVDSSVTFFANPKAFRDLILMIRASTVSSRGAKDTLRIMFEKGGNPNEIAEANGFIVKNDMGALKAVVIEIIAANPKVVADFKAGKAAALQFLVGQGMKVMKGSGNPEILRKLFMENL